MKECQTCKTCYTDDVDICPNDDMPTFHSLSGEPVLEGKYHLESRLGQGGMGVVYKARHAYLKTQLAIKIILPDLVGNDPQLVTRFRQEALAAAAIRHQNVVNVTDYGVAQGTMPFLVMEYVEGETLHELLEREKQLSPEKTLELMCAIGGGIGAAHKQGIVHRDLKPLNVMILDDRDSLSEAVKILDFGLAKIKSGELLGSFIQAQTTGLMGSPYYMSPEQWADEEPDASSDIYSLGVLLFQMLTGDVPFKGSSIPAIMKKHISDLPPTFAEIGVQISPAVERVIRHTLEKDRANRTQSVEQLIDELTRAVNNSPNIDAGDIPCFTDENAVSTISIFTKPPQSYVFIDNVAFGTSRDDGWLRVENVESGEHHIRVKHKEFRDWEGNFTCDGRPQQIIAQLEADTGAIPEPSFKTVPAFSANTPQNLSDTVAGQQSEIHQTDAQNYQTVMENSRAGFNVPAAEPQKRKSAFFSPLILGIIGISGLLLLISIGVGGAYLAGAFGGTAVEVANTNVKTANTNQNANAETIKNNVSEMVLIPGGTFTMGRDDGTPIEQKEHKVTINSFYMDKTEVINREYYQFVKDTKYKPVPANWEGGKPFDKDLNLPVRFVSFNDANAFAAWRSKRDNGIYRLPTEEEWEYAARNGSKSNLYPWGDKFKDDCAVLNKQNTEPSPVGSKPCGNNAYGVTDLIGNVFEWTSSKPYLYPGSPLVMEGAEGTKYMIRGGSAKQKSTGKLAITSTFRLDIDADKRDAELGFRLVRPE